MYILMYACMHVCMYMYTISKALRYYITKGNMAEQAILAARPKGKGKSTKMSASLGISGAVVEEGEEDEEEEQEDEEEEEGEEPRIEEEEEEEGKRGGKSVGPEELQVKSEQQKKEERDKRAHAEAERAWAQLEDNQLVDMTEEHAKKQEQQVLKAS
jgi:hypothetical protein